MPKPVSNPPNPWDSSHRTYLGEPPPATLEIFEENAKSVLSSNKSPDLPFGYSLNPYRGCFHGCSYCYARTTHQFLGWGAGTDFDRKIVVKINAPRVLRSQIFKPTWQGHAILFSGNTDCYQPLEASYELTRQCLEVCIERGNPLAIITKGSLVRRDLDLLVKLNEKTEATVFVSIPFADNETCRKIEPFASPASERFETVRILSSAGIPTGIGIAPVIPGLNESQISEILHRARDSGAKRAFMTLLRLPQEVREVFHERVTEAFPLRAKKILNSIQEVRSDQKNQAGFGERQRGKGPRWEMIRQIFDSTARKLDLHPRDDVFSHRAAPLQPTLFDLDD